MIGLAAEAVEARPIGNVRDVETAGRGDYVLRAEPVTRCGADIPFVLGVVEGQFVHARAESDALAQIEAVRDMIRVGLEVRLG